MSAPNEATRLQNAASDPDASVWLSANAGSGKTRVLTDRVARLLLGGADPQGILCLTYTKAAASEMQNRLFKRLGEWAMLGDAKLSEQLDQLGIVGPPDLAEARRLFARAIETPGGLRIQTIHSFCAGLLRRFPLEAGVSPQFAEMDEAAQTHLITEVIDRMAEGPDRPALKGLAAIHSGQEIERFFREIVTHRDHVPDDPDTARLAAVFGLDPSADERLAIDIAFEGIDPDFIAKCAQLFANMSTVMGKVADQLRRIGPGPFTEADFDALCRAVLIADGSKAKHNVPTKDAKGALGNETALFEQLVAQTERAAETMRAVRAMRRSLALHRFARAAIRAYDTAKTARGWLDFDDLITRTERLLTDPARAAWVLYRLDGGIRHVLIDEAQDTSPAQWRVIDLLTQEFGQDSDKKRSLFVVGDRKQSIYSFQGAAPEEFEDRHAQFARRLSASSTLERRELFYSFRSATAVLTAVDTVFEHDPESGVKEAHPHRAFFETIPGRVDLWPALGPAPTREPGDWFDPVDQFSEDHHQVVLAQRIAAEIGRLIAEETIPFDNGKARRKVTAGDVLILVQGRQGQLFSEIIRACKKAKLPVAGADRLRIGAELAVKDLRALLGFLALPEDDLSLAAALRSPLFGWSEDQLFRIAHGRGGRFLWHVLRDRDDEHPETLAILRDLRDRADFLRPFDLIERALTRHGGRERLVARLGHEAEDGIDELLNQALLYERQDVPSLTGFLAWLEGEDVEIKRQMDTATDRIRVMTVHGAKGLEAPIVILPDTLRERNNRTGNVARIEDGPILWSGRTAENPGVIREAEATAAEADARERKRLLYVAMTRAESWLIVCGAGDAKEDGKGWYPTVARGFAALETVAIDTPTGPGLRHASGDWTALPLKEPDSRTSEPEMLPPWAQAVAVAPPDDDRPLSPSDLGGAKALQGDPALADEDASLRRGTAIHALLEHLPRHPEHFWAEAAAQILAAGEVSEGERAGIFDEARRVLTDPALSPLFGPDALVEVEIAARLPELGGRRILGAIDRLVIEGDLVLIVDYKSNVLVPERAEDTPIGLLRQLGAYRSAAGQIYPNHRIETAILWTRAPRLLRYDDNIVMEALQSLGTS